MAGAAKSIYIIVSVSSHIVRVAGINRYLFIFKGIPAPSSNSSTVEPLRGYNKKSDGFSIGFFVYMVFELQLDGRAHKGNEKKPA